MINQTTDIAFQGLFMLEGLKIDTRKNTVKRENTYINIEPRLMRIIVRLAQEPGEIVKREELLNQISENEYVSDESLTQAISKIRQILRDSPRNPTFIKTIPRRGYVLLAQPQVIVDITDEEKQLSTSDVEPNENQNRRLASKVKHMTFITIILAIILLLLIVLWPNETVFIEKGDIEFIEKSDSESIEKNDKFLSDE